MDFSDEDDGDDDDDDDEDWDALGIRNRFLLKGLGLFSKLCS